MKKKYYVYLGHALSKAPAWFRKKMLTARTEINGIDGIEVLEFNWKEGVGPDRSINVYEHDTMQVRKADLALFVLDYTSEGAAIEILERCIIGKEIAVFTSPDTRIGQMIPDLIAHWSKRKPGLHWKGIETYDNIHDIVWKVHLRRLTSIERIRGKRKTRTT